MMNDQKHRKILRSIKFTDSYKVNDIIEDLILLGRYKTFGGFERVLLKLVRFIGTTWVGYEDSCVPYDDRKVSYMKWDRLHRENIRLKYENEKLREYVKMTAGDDVYQNIAKELSKQ